ncbi:hypothetical protein VCHC55B2_3562A, partial [Vibrio cholerae HC-55B2]
MVAFFIYYYYTQ